MTPAVASFFYYLSAYSLGIVVLASVARGMRARRYTPQRWFFLSTLIMTLTVFVSTLQNFLRLSTDHAGSELLSGINYLTAFLFTVAMLRFFHAVYPWRGARAVNGIALAVTGVLAALTALRFLIELPASIFMMVSDMLLFAKNAAILYTSILTIACRRRTERSRTIRFTRIIVPIVLVCMPIMLVTELNFFIPYTLRFFPEIRLSGPWALPGIYIVWCFAWLLAGAAAGKGEPATPTDAFCDLYGISPRERDVMVLLVQGRSYREITETLFISLPTVKSHVSSLYRKTNTVNRLELAVKAGLIAPESP